MPSLQRWWVGGVIVPLCVCEIGARSSHGIANLGWIAGSPTESLTSDGSPRSLRLRLPPHGIANLGWIANAKPGIEAEGPSSIGEGIDTTSALVARETAPTETETSAIATAGIAELRRQLTQELSTIDTGIDTPPSDKTAPVTSDKPAIAARAEAPKQAEAPKPIDWSPPGRGRGVLIRCGVWTS